MVELMPTASIARWWLELYRGTTDDRFARRYWGRDRAIFSIRETQIA